MSERERVARLKTWLNAYLPVSAQMAAEQDTQEAIDLWLDLKWLHDELLDLLAERQEPVAWQIERPKSESSVFPFVTRSKTLMRHCQKHGATARPLYLSLHPNRRRG
jgi:hypothetical protein